MYIPREGVSQRRAQSCISSSVPQSDLTFLMVFGMPASALVQTHQPRLPKRPSWDSPPVIQRAEPS